MLQWTAGGSGARFVGIVHHTDAEREWAYDRASHIGKLEKAWDEALAKGWTVVDMKKGLEGDLPAGEVSPPPIRLGAPRIQLGAQQPAAHPRVSSDPDERGLGGLRRGRHG